MDERINNFNLENKTVGLKNAQFARDIVQLFDKKSLFWGSNRNHKWYTERNLAKRPKNEHTLASRKLPKIS